MTEERDLIVHLPEEYAKSGKRYPVLYLLDGKRHLYHSVLATQLLNKAKKIPELIIVAISNKENMRERDLNTESEKFTLFLRSEVMTYVNKNYRTTGSNILFGHSLAGFYTVDLLANHPETFESYIAASPPLQGDDITLYNKIMADSSVYKTEKKTLYLTLASKEEEGDDVASAMSNFVTLLSKEYPEGFDWHYQPLDGQTHITTSYLTLFHGITYVFKN
ncbi:alpha/beta hydrolase-fold protein [uncultured Shewanella sp.]|uniref:alpha/beta hydrolase n=1 Tax=uncultured Shewanella sp. TaxID=173975 RepID=UPI00260A897B|nr:alpha/beta hydrolase-fold protein [uncultured Shewanella sp.]